MTATPDPEVHVYRVGVLALAEGPPIVPIGVVDLLRKSQLLGPGERRIDVLLISGGPSTTVNCNGGIELRCDATIGEAPDLDLLIVPAIDPDIVTNLGANAAAIALVRKVYEGGGDVASVCTGAFILGAAGVLRGRVATTHWAFQPLFAALYPEVRLAPEAVLVDTGRVITSGGATSFLNLTLLLVERLLGRDVGRAASRMFLVDVNKSPQSAYAGLHAQKNHGDQQILAIQQRIEAGLDGDLTIPALARVAGMSARTFTRRFQSATGASPLSYIQQARIEAARRVLETTDERVSAVAARFQYADVSAFRRIFVRTTGLAPAEYRARYGKRTPPSLVSAIEPS